MNFHKVFVYGTLKRGEPNHTWFKPDNGMANFLGEGRTVTKFPLIIGTKYNIPFLLYQPDDGHNVLGEIYEVDDKMLSNLDILEDHPNFYVRSLSEIQKGDDILKCWVYFITKFKPGLLLEKQKLESYSSNGPHNLRYCERYLRDPSYDYKPDIMNVLGEIYEVDDKMLTNLDVLEDHPNLYERTSTDIQIGDNIVKCWAYFLKKFSPKLLKKQQFKSYSSNGPHNLPYSEKYFQQQVMATSQKLCDNESTLSDLNGG